MMPLPEDMCVIVERGMLVKYVDGEVVDAETTLVLVTGDSSVTARMASLTLTNASYALSR